MKHVLGSRRFVLALVGIGCLTVLGWRGQEVGLHIATIVIGVAAANSYQNKGNKG